MWGAFRSRARRGCVCSTGATVTAFADATAGISLSKVGAGTPTTVCSPDSGCGMAMLSTAAFEYSTDAGLRSVMLATHTISVMARVSTLAHDHYLMSYTQGPSDASGAYNYLAALRIAASSGFGNSWEYSTGVNVDFYSGFKPQTGVWHLYSARMTIGATTICELLVDGKVVATSGALTNAGNGTASYLRYGNGGNSGTEHEGATAFADVSNVARSDNYLQNLRGFGRSWGRDGNTIARLIPVAA